MRSFEFKKIDAFATETSGGNPAGAIYLDRENDISIDEMQRIAKELKGFVSEVGFLWQTDENIFHLKYYSSEREVDFCGHATIAIMYDLIKNNDKLRDKEQIHLVTNKGGSIVENRIESEDAVFISAPNPTFRSGDVEKESLANALGIEAEGISDDYPISAVNAGLETLLVPIDNLTTILSLSPELEGLKQYCVKNSIDIMTVFTDEVVGGANEYRTRVFAPTFGYLEDPATGSGNAALGYYLLKNKRWDGRRISLEQGGDINNPNIVKLIARDSGERRKLVVFGGSAIVRIKGEYILS